MKFIMFINILMPKNCWHLYIYTYNIWEFESKKSPYFSDSIYEQFWFMLSWAWKNFITSEPVYISALSNHQSNDLLKT